MRSFFALLLAMVVALATAVVPDDKTAKAAHSDTPGAVEAQVAVQTAPGAHKPGAPLKRCQRGAGMLGCPFHAPHVVPPARSSLVTPVHFHPQIDTMTGRPIPAAFRPPKSPSA